MVTRFRWLVVAMALVLALAAATAVAHEDPAESVPADGSVVRTPPQEVTITFPGELDANGSSIKVVGPGGDDVTADGAGVNLDNPDRNTLVAPLAGDLPDGEYTVEWVALSLADGHETSGDFSFTVDPNAPEEASPVVAAPESTTTPIPVEDVAEDDDSGISRGALIVGGAAVVAALAVVGSVGARRWRR
ncbi:MAG TPA: copper resistance protein CopC [Thermomicrobiales bacterium]|nr:copper resistance protein CopC [Thermomicrobiales bacterium]